MQWGIIAESLKGHSAAAAASGGPSYSHRGECQVRGGGPRG